MKLSIKNISNEQLKFISDLFVARDHLTFDITTAGKGFPAEVASCVMLKIQLDDTDSKIVVINDISLHMFKALLESGFRKENIYLAYGKWGKKGISTLDKNLYNTMRLYAENTFDEFTDSCNIITLEELLNMSVTFDYIIANPPYEIGNDITYAVLNNVSFSKGYINLMPISKYKKGDLYKHIIPGTIEHSTTTTNFNGAYTTPVCSEIGIDEYTADEYDVFELKMLYDQRLKKFWEGQLNRDNTFLMHMSMVHQKDFANISSKTSFSCGIYTPNIMLGDGPKTLKNRDGSFRTNDRHYIWNFLKPDNTIDNYFKASAKGDVGQTVTIFATEQEADNFKAWAHSGELSGRGRLQGLFSILLRGMNKPTGCPFPYAIPRVDWSRPWTDEEILADYGYTEDEIKEILHFNDDLKKEQFKGRIR